LTKVVIFVRSTSGLGKLIDDASILKLKKNYTYLIFNTITSFLTPLTPFRFANRRIALEKKKRYQRNEETAALR
jgi:hypothetical protein